MILLLGGTSETAPLAAGMVKAGFAVLVSVATDIPLELDDHPQLRRRSGPLDAPGLEELIRDNAIRVLVDATHPYSTAISVLAAGIPAEMVIAAKGPFSVEENVNTIRKFGIGVLVTKDSGAAGGVPAKIAAAKLEKCGVIVVERPLTGDGLMFQSVEKLIKYLEINKHME